MAAVTPIIILGATGRMGRRLIELVLREPRAKLVGAVTRSDHPEIGRDAATLVGAPNCGVELSGSLATHLATGVQNAVVIDFSTVRSTLLAAKLCAARGVGMVVGTTGLSPEELVELQAHRDRMPLLISANFSLGINVLLGLVHDAARLLAGFDLEILEIHHGKKRDAPSGTALRIGESLAEARARSLGEVAVTARSGDVGPRTPQEIGIVALRGGDVVGEHTAYFFGQGERLELTHRATSRDTFAAGAIRSALWLGGKLPGLYDMRDVLGLSRK